MTFADQDDLVGEVRFAHPKDDGTLSADKQGKLISNRFKEGHAWFMKSRNTYWTESFGQFTENGFKSESYSKALQFLDSEGKDITKGIIEKLKTKLSTYSDSSL